MYFVEIAFGVSKTLKHLTTTRNAERLLIFTWEMLEDLNAVIINSPWTGNVL